MLGPAATVARASACAIPAAALRWCMGTAPCFPPAPWMAVSSSNCGFPVMPANSPDEAAQSAEGGGEPPAVRVAIVDDEAPGRANPPLAPAPPTGWRVGARCDR